MVWWALPSSRSPSSLIAAMSPSEARFERLRRTIGLFAGPLVGIIVWMIAMPGLSDDAHTLAAVVALVVVWWVSEAIPIPATALIGAALTVVFGITTAQAAFAPFASPIIFLFIGSFMIGRAVAGLDDGVFPRRDRRAAFDPGDHLYRLTGIDQGAGHRTDQGPQALVTTDQQPGHAQQHAEKRAQAGQRVGAGLAGRPPHHHRTAHQQQAGHTRQQ